MSEFIEGQVNLEKSEDEERLEALKKHVIDSCLLTLGKLGINPKTLSQEEIDVFNETSNKVFEMYKPEFDKEASLSEDQLDELPKWNGRLSAPDYMDHIVNSWLISVCGVTINEMAAMQGFSEDEDSSVLAGIIGLGGRNQNAKELFETPDRRKQLSSHPSIVLHRHEIQRKVARITTKEKSEQETKAEIDKRLDRTGD